MSGQADTKLRLMTICRYGILWQIVNSVFLSFVTRIKKNFSYSFLKAGQIEIGRSFSTERWSPFLKNDFWNFEGIWEMFRIEGKFMKYSSGLKYTVFGFGLVMYENTKD